MHNHDGKEGGLMTWAMIICCAVPLLLIILFGIGGKSVGAPIWVVIGGIAVMIITYFFMLGRSHKYSDKEKSSEGERKAKDHSGHGCCH